MPPSLTVLAASTWSSPAGGDTFGQTSGLAGGHWPRAPVARITGTLIESRKENEHLTSVIRSLPYSLQAPALLQSHGGGVGTTSDGGQVVLSRGDLPDPWISNDHKHAVISLC